MIGRHMANLVTNHGGNRRVILHLIHQSLVDRYIGSSGHKGIESILRQQNDFPTFIGEVAYRMNTFENTQKTVVRTAIHPTIDPVIFSHDSPHRGITLCNLLSTGMKAYRALSSN